MSTVSGVGPLFVVAGGCFLSCVTGSGSLSPFTRGLLSPIASSGLLSLASSLILSLPNIPFYVCCFFLPSSTTPLSPYFAMSLTRKRLFDKTFLT